MANTKNIEILKKFLQEKPPVSFEDSKSFPSEEKIYTIAGMKRYFRSIGLSNSELDEAFNKIQNEKGFDLRSISVYNPTFESRYPYFYTPEVADVVDIVSRLEKEGKELRSRSFKSDDNLQKAIKKKKVK